MTSLLIKRLLVLLLALFLPLQAIAAPLAAAGCRHDAQGADKAHGAHGGHHAGHAAQHDAGNGGSHCQHGCDGCSACQHCNVPALPSLPIPAAIRATHQPPMLSVLTPAPIFPERFERPPAA